MKVVKKTSEYVISQRKDKRYAVQDSYNKAVNGEEKVKILLAEGLIELKTAAPKPEEAVAEEAPAEESSEDAAE